MERVFLKYMVNLAVLGPKRCIKWKRVGLGFVGYNSISRPHRGLVQEADRPRGA